MLSTKNKKRPLIGITIGAKSSTFTMLCLRAAVYLAGGRPILVGPGVNMDKVREVTGLVVSGGSDIDPSLYGHENTHSVDIDYDRDLFEKECVTMALTSKLPMLGICRGSQMINIVCGGTLHQDAASQFDGFIPTNSVWAKVITRRKVTLQVGTRLSRIMKTPETLWVNSIHHQAHNLIGQGLTPVASDAHGIVQGIESTRPDHFIVGVQWHPEFLLYSRRQRSIFEALVSASLGNSAVSTSFGNKVSQKRNEPATSGLLGTG